MNNLVPKVEPGESNSQPPSEKSTRAEFQLEEPQLLSNASRRPLGIIKEALFIATVCSAQLLAQAQLGACMIPLMYIGDYLGTQDPGQLSWIPASYSLTLGIFVIVSGRLGDMYGPRRVWLSGFAISIAGNIGSGFCRSRIPFDICRAIAGAGGSLTVPNSVATLGRVYPAGKKRTFLFAILGALGPAGFAIGGVFGALLAQTVGVQWIWFVTAIAGTIFGLSGLFVLPKDCTAHPRQKFDTVGFLLSTAGFILFDFTWNQGTVVGWPEPYVYALLIVSVLCIAGFFIWERYTESHAALVPREVLHKEALLVYLCLWLGWSSFGVFLYYTNVFIRDVRGAHLPLALVAQLSPLAPGGIIAALLVPVIIHRYPSHWIFSVSMVSFFVGNLIMCLTPPQQTYWAMIFPALCLVVWGPDLSFTAGQVIVSDSVGHDFQGIAAGIVSMITNYSLSIGLGMAGTVERYVPSDSVFKGYRTAFYFGTGLGAFAVVVVLLFVRMPRKAHDA